MATSPIPMDRSARRLAQVEEHVRCENAHDLDGVLATFGEVARYDDEPWGEHHDGREGVRNFYSRMMAALPDLSIEIVRRHVTEEAVVLEVMIRGTHLGGWRGLPATGRKIEFPLCGVFTFSEDDRLAGERIYYDRAMIFRQLGVYHEADTLAGRVETLLAHPWTLTRAVMRNLRRKS